MEKYELFKNDVNSLIGIDLNLYKEKQMKRRILSLLTKNKFNDFDDYFMSLRKDKELLNEFINHLTINVSEFYRNRAQWDVLKNTIIPELIQDNHKELKIWSAACSTGDEPYSLVMAMTDFFPLDKIRVLATDIDEGAIEKAKQGLYNEKSLKNLPDKFKSKYFQKIGQSYRISDEIKNRVDFQKMDLLRDRFPSNLDLIVCRNVMIYFTDEAKDSLCQKFNNSLRRYGILFVGSTEQIITPQQYSFESGKTFFYKKI